MCVCVCVVCLCVEGMARKEMEVNGGGGGRGGVEGPGHGGERSYTAPHTALRESGTIGKERERRGKWT